MAGKGKSLVELPPECIITDRRTWERQRTELGRLEGTTRVQAERIQALVQANEALRRRVAQAEALALEQLARAEKEQARADALADRVAPLARACTLAQGALRQVVASGGRGTHGGKPQDALDAIARARKGSS